MNLRTSVSALLFAAVAATSAGASAQTRAPGPIVIAGERAPADPDHVVGRNLPRDFVNETTETRSSPSSEIPSYSRWNDSRTTLGNSKRFRVDLRVGTAVSARHNAANIGNEVRADGRVNLDLWIFKKKLQAFDSHTYAIYRSEADRHAYTRAYLLGQAIFDKGFSGSAPKVNWSNVKTRQFAGGCETFSIWFFQVEACAGASGSLGVVTKADASQARRAFVEMGPEAALDGTASALLTGPFGQVGVGPQIDVRVLGMELKRRATSKYTARLFETEYEYDQWRDGCLQALEGKFSLKWKAFWAEGTKKLFDWDGFEKCWDSLRDTGSVTVETGPVYKAP